MDTTVSYGDIAVNTYLFLSLEVGGLLIFTVGLLAALVDMRAVTFHYGLRTTPLLHAATKTAIRLGKLLILSAFIWSVAARSHLVIELSALTIYALVCTIARRG